ncbi:hypothetical protein ALC60_01839 [Trachymyrmex zeteki]|uniref:Uncharacterized protein n=1 Tax=Mycetomoellerius zeteki TaxID=64791 RepID=A0A151XFU8_9HYME|nr:hypothetical protein ALC60_01839 [Trachymyrmex zeteki]
MASSIAFSKVALPHFAILSRDRIKTSPSSKGCDPEFHPIREPRRLGLERCGTVNGESCGQLRADMTCRQRANFTHVSIEARTVYLRVGASNAIYGGGGIA